MTINADWKNRKVVWRMHPQDARDLADFLEQELSPKDLGYADIARLRQAADQAEPRRR